MIELPDGEMILGRELIAELGGGADPSVSRRHGRIFAKDGVHYVQDLGSRNGVLLSGRRVEGAMPLIAGDQIEIGAHRFAIATRGAESARDLYAAATIAATKSGAPERLRLVYELAGMLEDPGRPESIAARLIAIFERVLSPAEAQVLWALDDSTRAFDKKSLEEVLNSGRVLRKQSGTETAALALPFGIEPEGVVLLVAGERRLNDDDVAFVSAAVTLASSALARARREAALSLQASEEIVGASETLLRAKRKIDLIAPHAELSVLLIGETGTGKELFARRLHLLSGRPGPFVPVNVAALASELLESELFGHAKGAFTGADRARAGYIEMAHGGTLFLDELGEMPLTVQVKLLRVLQERKLNRVGETRAIAVDLRLITATNADLEAKMRTGTFREDLYYRVAEQQTRIPPLRERSGDIEILAHTFIEKIRRQRATSVRSLEPEALEVLRLYSWPGNVRQLEGTIRLAMIHAAAEGASSIGVEHLDERLREAAPVPRIEGPLGKELENAERAVVVKALRATKGNKRAAARQLGMSINTLRNRIDRYEIAATEYAE